MASAIVANIQLPNKSLEVILNKLIVVKTAINSVIINVIMLVTIIEIDCIIFNFSKKTDSKNTVGYITIRLKKVKIPLVKQPISNSATNDIKNIAICFLLKCISSFDIILAIEIMKYDHSPASRIELRPLTIKNSI